MKDFKKMPKMACGGGVGKYEDGGSVDLDTHTPKAVKTTPITSQKSKGIGLVKQYKEPKESSTSIPKYDGSEMPVSEVTKSFLKRGGKVKRGNKK